LSRALRLLLATLSCLWLSLGCRVSPPVAAQSQLDLAWSRSEVTPERSAAGDALEAIPVRGGDVVRLELSSSDPFELGERQASAAGFVDVWQTLQPEEGVALLRVSLGARELLARPGKIRRALLARPADPGYAWFVAEQRALDWATTPFGTAWPELGIPSHIDAQRWTDLDRMLAAALAHSSAKNRDLLAARAMRRVAALRIVREARPIDGLPYFYLEPAELVGHGESRELELGPGALQKLAVRGPAQLALSVAASPTSSVPVQCELTEHGRSRGSIALGATAHGKAPPRGHLRLHVPPGAHVYELRAQPPVVVRALVARAAVHWEDLLAKDEGHWLELAARACAPPSSPALCLAARTLAGTDDATEDRTTGDVLGYAAAWSGSDADARRVAADLGLAPLLRGARSADAGGDARGPAALLRANRAVEQSLNADAREAWARLSLESTAWRVEPRADSGPEPWWAELPVPERSCTRDGELSDSPIELRTSAWHGAPTLRLLVAAGCSGASPIVLEVDGQALAAQPSAAIVEWHIRTRGSQAHVRRLDHTSAHVYPLAEGEHTCASHWDRIAPPTLAVGQPELRFAASVEAPGIELWLREDRGHARLSLQGAAGETLHLDLRSKGADWALDGGGRRWARVARVALPAWARSGTRVISGAEYVAFRELTRTARQRDAKPAVPSGREASVAPSVAMLTELSARILEAPDTGRAALYAERALGLARWGAARGALADAKAADALGLVTNDGQPLAAKILALSAAAKPAQLEPLTSGAAFGIEPDFDQGQRRCEPGEGPRTRLQRALLELEQSRLPFDAARAATALAVAAEVPDDPRSATLRARATRGSRYRELRSVDGNARRRRYETQASTEPQTAGPADVWGELRPQVASGGRFEPGTFVVADAERPAKARLQALPPGASPELQLICYPREPSAVRESCVPQVSVADRPLPLQPLAANTWRAPLSLPQGGELSISPADAPARWAVLARIVLKRSVPGATEVPGVGWILAPRPHEYRFELVPGQAVEVAAREPRLLRFSVHAAAGADVHVAQGDHVEQIDDDAPHEVVLQAGQVLRIGANQPGASLALSERVPLEAGEHAAPVGASALRSSGERAPLQPAPALFRFDRESAGGWRDQVRAANAPLTPLQENLGTLIFENGVTTGNVKNRAAAGTGTSTYAFTRVGYRRRIETLGLWTNASGFARWRSGESTLGASGSLYWDLREWHARLSTSAGVVEQRVTGVDARTYHFRGFAEYSQRLHHTWFLLPRLGWDFEDPSLSFRPSSLVDADEEIYDPYRRQRPLFAFAQALLWFAPHFDDIFYLRARATENATRGVFSHASVRPGAFVLLGDLDLSAYADTTWYAAADNLDGQGHRRSTLGFNATYDGWFARGSLDVAPSLATWLRPSDGAYQVSLWLTVLGSYHRGLRDFSSLELDFPEQRSGGVPWREALRRQP
jgi:hypothetical protein